jgi:type II secretory pathway pseudopilin PulG
MDLKMILNKYNSNKGFSLVEMLLTVMVVTGLLFAIFNLLEDYAEKELAQSTAEYMDNIALAVQDVIDDPLHFQTVYALADARANDVLEVTLNQVINGYDTIPASTRLNENVRDRNPLGAQIAILMRIADNPASTTDVQAMEIIVATTDRINDERLRLAATASGPYGGSVRVDGDPIESAFATWSLNPADFTGTNWANEMTANPASIDDGGYLVHYRYTSFEDSAGDYMFRVSIPGRPELNRMYGTLNMGGHNIMGADNVTTANDLILDGRALVNGQMRVGGNTSIQQGDVVAGNRFSTNNMAVRGLGGGVTGNLNVDDSITVQNLNLIGNLNAETANFRQGLNSTGNIATQQIEYQNGTTQTGRLNVTSLQGNGAGMNVDITGQLNASNFSTQNMTVQSGNVGTIDTVISNNLRVEGDVESTGMILNNLNVQTFGACDNGC